MFLIVLLSCLHVETMGSIAAPNRTTLLCTATSLPVNTPLSANATILTTTLFETAWHTPLNVWNKSPNPVAIQLCADEECVLGTNKLNCTPELPSTYNGSLRLPSYLNNQTFGAVRIVYCSALKNGGCFDGQDPRYENIVTTTTDGNINDNSAFAKQDSTWPTLHVEIPKVFNNAALCDTDLDCINTSRPICNRNYYLTSGPRCVTVQHFLGQCGSPCLLQKKGYRCWCHEINDKFMYSAGAVVLCFLTYSYLSCRIKRATTLALSKNPWGLKHAILPLYKSCFQFLGLYLFTTCSLRLLLSLDDSVFHFTSIS